MISKFFLSEDELKNEIANTLRQSSSMTIVESISNDKIYTFEYNYNDIVIECKDNNHTKIDIRQLIEKYRQISQEYDSNYYISQIYEYLVKNIMNLLTYYDYLDNVDIRANIEYLSKLIVENKCDYYERFKKFVREKYKVKYVYYALHHPQFRSRILCQSSWAVLYLDKLLITDFDLKDLKSYIKITKNTPKNLSILA